MGVECMMPMALRMARRASRDEEAEGVALLALVEAERAFEPGRMPLAEWCALSVQNALSHWKRSEGRRQHLGLVDNLAPDCAAHAGPQLSDVVAAMPEELRQLAALKWEHKWPDGLVRAQLGCSWGQYNNMLARARALAAKYLEDIACVA